MKAINFAAKYVIFYGCMAASVLFANAYAATKPALLWCHDCGQDQKSRLARTVPAGTNVYVADAIKKTVEAYYVSQYDELIDGTTKVIHIKYLEPIPQDPVAVDAIHGAMDYYNAAPVGMTKIIPSTKEYSGSVYDVANAGSADQNNFSDWVNVQVGKNNAIAGLLNVGFQALTMFHVLDANSTPVLGYKITFADGSTVLASWDRKTASFKLDPDAARDAEGNAVPYIGLDGLVHNLGGNRVFDLYSQVGKSDLNKFMGQLSLMGVPVGSPSASGWACTKVSEGELVCRYYQN